MTALADLELYLTLWLHRMLVTTAAASSSVQGYLVLSRNSSQRGFKEAPYRSSALNSTSKKRMAAAGVLSGHTPHTSKRGALQAEEEAGKQMPDLLKDGCVKTPALTGWPRTATPCEGGKEHAMSSLLLLYAAAMLLSCMCLSVEGR